MSAALPTIDVKGWCPGALRPMPSGDGLIARLRPWCGAFTLDQADGIAEIAARLGNGHIDLTRRANLQIRGLREASLKELHRSLARLGLLDPDPETEAARNLMVGPLAGIDPTERLDVRPIAAGLTRAIISERQFAFLSAKFGWLVDGGGIASIAGERADIALSATGQGVALGLDGQWLGATAPLHAVEMALVAARAFLAFGIPGRMRGLSPAQFAALRKKIEPLLAPLEEHPKSGPRPVGALLGAVGLALPFGRVQATELGTLVRLARAAGAPDMRVSPWRTLYMKTSEPGRVLEGARRLGLIVEAGDPLLRIDACPGAPACRSASVDTRRDAHRLAASGFCGSLHVSGCSKGCARSGPADLVLVGERGRYRVIRNGVARDPGGPAISVDELMAAIHG